MQGITSLSLVIFFYRLYILKDVFTYMVLIDSGKRFWGIHLSIICYALWILPVSVEDFAHKQDGSLSNEDKMIRAPRFRHSVIRNGASVDGSFSSPDWLFLWLLSNSRIIFPFWEKELAAWLFSKKSRANKWVGVEQGMTLSQRAQTKKDRFRDRSLLRFIRDRHYLNWFSTLRKDSSIAVGLSTESVAPVSMRTERDSFPIFRGVSLRQLRGRTGKSTSRSSKPHH